MRRQEVVREAYRWTQAARTETKCRHLGTPVVVEGMQRGREQLAANTNDKMQFPFFSDVTTVIHRAMDQMQHGSITLFF
uniref:Uncharacterized protein n=1 Tax=Colobus angolensis palliatus TaxID=336983 RepID=A0A2K5J674_COLAP